MNIMSIKSHSLMYAMLAVFTGVSLLFTQACETPSSPSFQTKQTYNIALLSDKQYLLLGDSGAIIDTTSADFRDRFDVDPETNLISLGFDAGYPIGDVSEILPEVEAEPLVMVTDVPQLLPDFETDPEVDFENVTGKPASEFPAGTFLEGNTVGPMDILQEIDRLVEAEIVQGGVIITLNNNLGFDLSRVRFSLISDGTLLGIELEVFDLKDGETSINEVRLSEGDLLRVPLQVRTTFEWADQNMSRDAGQFSLSSQNSSDLEISRAVGTFPKREAARFFETELNEDYFIYTSPDDFVDISEGSFSFNEIINEIDLDFDSLTFSFPTAYHIDDSGAFMPGDTLSFVISGEERIRRSSHPSNIDGRNFSYEVEDLRIFAQDGKIPITVTGVTEDTRLAPPGERVREVNFSEELSARAEDISGVSKRASGFINPRIFAVSGLGGDPDDESDDLDLLNPDDRESVDFEELEFDSFRVEDLGLAGATMDLVYNTNINIENDAYTALLGINQQGEEFFLRGKEGSALEVAAEDSISGMFYDGSAIDNSDLLKVRVKRSDDLSEAGGVIRMSNENSNINAFLSQLPTEVFTISKVLVNPDERSGFVERPVDIEADLRLNIPFRLQNNERPANISDTVSVSLADLPAREDDLYIEQGSIIIQYENRLPVDVGLNLVFLDEENTVLTESPLPDGGEIRALAAPNGPDGFSSGPQINSMRIDLNEEQLRLLNRTRNLLIQGELLTEADIPVGLRASDSIKLDVQSEFVVRIRVD